MGLLRMKEVDGLIAIAQEVEGGLVVIRITKEQAETLMERLKGMVGKKKKIGTQVPKDFSPNEASVKKAGELGINWQIEVPKFIDHHSMKGTVGKDWQAGFRTWLNNSIKYGTAEMREKPKLSAATCCICGHPASRKEMSQWYCSKHDRYSLAAA